MKTVDKGNLLNGICTHRYVGAQRYDKDAAGSQHDGLLQIVQKVSERGLIALIGPQPVGVKETVGELLAVGRDHVANVAEGKGLQQQIKDENGCAQASPEIREEDDVDDGEADDDAAEQKLYKNCGGNDGTQRVAISVDRKVD